MGNEIKVNDFVRLKDGTIAKVLEIKNQDSDVLNYYCLNNDMGTLEKNIAKHSPNLIDLIQCGDYVNGKQVSNVDKVDNINFIEWTDGDMYKTEIKNDKFIETIVTKEQFESISYKVKQEEK